MSRRGRTSEGIALGCATYAQHTLLPRVGLEAPAPRRAPHSAYQGRAYGEREVGAAVDELAPWLLDLTDELPPSDDPPLQAALQVPPQPPSRSCHGAHHLRPERTTHPAHWPPPLPPPARALCRRCSTARSSAGLTVARRWAHARSVIAPSSLTRGAPTRTSA
eukprot:3583502-Prymnesium_polylepis.1